MKIGYARISTDTQTHDAQIAALKAAGCEKIFTEVASGAKRDRPVLAEAMDYLRPDAQDTLVVYKLDRVARSLPHLIEIMECLKANGIEFQSVTEAIDTNTSSVLHPNEAVIPLTKGRKIPVDMGEVSNGGGSVYAPVNNTEITVSVEASGDVGDPKQQELLAETIAVTIDNKINERMAEQIQYGGLFSPRGS